MEVTCEDGTGVRLTAIDETECRVEADTNGDGDYDDYDSGPILWTEL